jgi:hypothetical protein
MLLSRPSLYVCLLAAITASCSAEDQCSQYTSCGDCLVHDFCGWCSPTAVVYSNGTLGKRCADQRDAPWTCNNLYQTKQCVRGYTCDATKGQCVLAAPGEGDTKAHCEAGCKVEQYFKCDWATGTCSKCSNATGPGCTKYGNGTDCTKACAVPESLYQCDPKTKQCNVCPHSYCTKNSDCPNSYCQITGPGPWTCHGSTCQQKYQCQDACGLSPELLGIWRGIEIQQGYAAGEHDWKIQNEAPQLTMKSPSGDVVTGSIEALDNMLNITLDNGINIKCIYKPYEPSPETEQFAFACSKANGPTAPSSVPAGMNGEDFVVTVMSKCKDKATKCDFSSVFATAAEPVPRRRMEKFARAAVVPFWLQKIARLDQVTDPCNQFADCASCINAPSGLCGWCDTPVNYTSGAPGANCAGFDHAGKANPPWVCHKKYRRESCNDWGCDWSNFSAPTCKELPAGTPGITKEQCELGCTKQEGIYKCNNQTFQCEKCNVKYCLTNADCPGSYCQIDTSKPGPYVCHDSNTAGCEDQSHCNATCGAPLVGTWRGIEMSSGFARGEWDFSAYTDGSISWKSADGTIFKGRMKAGDQSAVQEGQAIDIQVNSTVSFRGIFELDAKGNDGIVEMAFLTFSGSKQVVSFDDGMTGADEYVLLTCNEKSGEPCDFSKSAIPEERQ